MAETCPVCGRDASGCLAMTRTPEHRREVLEALIRALEADRDTEAFTDAVMTFTGLAGLDSRAKGC